MPRMITVTADDGPNAYTLQRDADANNATLNVKGVLTVKLARELIEDLQPLAGARAARPPRGTLGAPAKAKDATSPASKEGQS